MDLVSRIVFTSLLVYYSVGTPLDISFELEDSDINEIVFVDETDIVLRCYVAGEANDYTLSIEHENRHDPVLQSRNDNCLKHLIQKATMNDGGEYTCNVSFIGVDGSTQTTAKTLYLNVQDGISPKCFRNGTAGQPYNNGDLLLMTCYCRHKDRPCSWISTVSGSQRAIIEIPYETKNRFDKMILRLLVKVGSSNSTISTTRYDCANGPASTQRCQIGPQMDSSTDVIINSNTEDTFTGTVDCALLSTSTFLPEEGLNATPTISGAAETSPTLLSSPGNANTTYHVIVTGASVIVGIVLVVITVLIILFTLLKRRRRRDNNKKVRETATSLVYTNGSFTTDNNDEIDLNKDGYSTVNAISQRHVSQSDRLKRGADSADIGDVYAKIDKSMKKSGNDVLEMETASAHHISSACEPDSGTLYAKVDKDRRKHGDVMLSMEPTSEHHNASEGVEDFACLYAKVDKDRRNFGGEADEGRCQENGDGSDMYAEIDKK
ncbi:hypothetical protein HOLleu_24831 [Holothuria leucospilota]|uniref:Ig-like domain-containing protein n=1 Tax=Holothuria leucospilota TaxID=206669 RepID=A0A9Q1BRM2_HOLLE|nr:hypothetical protein HOLleu_24831 [Holothuria leucospilota]